ncbi:MAG: polysaccharide deacetylase family protein [Lautropia sp.]|nr:polysaccharide deacetylase family protein [Lautropia sp.]
MKSITVLMYHAIDRQGVIGADVHYSVEPVRFAHQLQLIRLYGGRPGSVLAELEADHARAPAAPANSRRPVCLTFDDGHISNAHAAEQIARHGGQADFFVNPSMVGKPGFLNWAELREMADMGMSIQSHGMHHRYLDQLQPGEVRAELADSRAAIEDGVGRPVSLYAPAGGRMPPGFMQLAYQLGYRAVCSSRVDLWQTARQPAAGDALEVPRLAVLNGTDEQRFTDWVVQKPLEILKQRSRYRLLQLSKRLLGNQGHEKLRALLLPGQTPTTAPPGSPPVSATRDTAAAPPSQHPEDPSR